MPGRLSRDQEVGQQRRVGPVHPDVRVTEPDVELQRPAEVDRSPDQVPEQDLVVEPGRRAGLDRAEQPPGGRGDVGRARPGRVEVEAVPVRDDRLVADSARPRGRDRQFLGEQGRPSGGGGARSRHLLGHRLEPHDMTGRGPAGLGQLLGRRELVALIAGVDQPPGHPGRGEQAAVHLRRPELGPAAQVVLGRRGRLEVEHGGAPASQREAKLAVEHRGARSRRPGSLGDQQLEGRPVQVTGDDAMHVVVDQCQRLCCGHASSCSVGSAASSA